MKNFGQEIVCEDGKPFVYQEGRIYFNRKTERKIFFVLTLVMLLSGIFSKLGLF